MADKCNTFQQLPEELKRAIELIYKIEERVSFIERKIDKLLERVK